MINGVFCLTEIDLFQQKKLDDLHSLITFPNSEVGSISTKNFSLTYIASNRFKLSSEDFIYRDSDSGVIIVFSGRIYNLNELFIQFQFNAQDKKVPEFLFWIYQKIGSDFIKLLNGDFSILIYDSIQKSFLLFRDHLGVHPMAYLKSKNTIYFSFDSKSLSRTFLMENKEINKEYLLDSFKFIDYNSLPNSKVVKLLPGHYIKYSNEGFQLIKYWYPEKTYSNFKISRIHFFDEITNRIKKAIKIRCDLKLNAASHLSGGLDSGLVAAIARNEYLNQKKFYGFSWTPLKAKPSEVDFDERDLIYDQCELNNIDPVFITLNEKDFFEYSSDLFRYTDYFEENMVLEESKIRNIDLIFSGYGGDEFVNIGNKGIDSDLFFKLQWDIFFKRYSLIYFKELVRTLLFEIIFPAINIIPSPVKKEIKEGVYYLKNEYKKPFKNSVNRFYFYKSRKELQLNYFYMYHLQVRLEDWFVKSLKAGVQYRFPLLDKDLIEYILSIPSKHLVLNKYSRIVAREITEGLLPESIRWRESGRDPVAHYYKRENLKACVLRFINDVAVYKNNPDLDFIDFIKLENDIEKFKESKDQAIFNRLLFPVFNIKMLHDYTKSYRQKSSIK